jgi:prefoldin subunit 5
MSENQSGTKSMTSRVEVLKMERSFLGEIARRQTANLSAVLQRIGKIEEEIQTLQREEHEQRTAKAHPEPVIGVEPDAP